jgi:hypothetical protein
MLYDYELRLRGLGTSVSEFVKRKEIGTSVRCRFDGSPVIHAINTVETINYELHIADDPVSLQHLANLPVEKLFGVTRLHAETDQTFSGMIEAMEYDQVTKFVTERQKVKKRQTDGEIINPDTISVETEEGVPGKLPGIYAKACLK